MGQWSRMSWWLGVVLCAKAACAQAPPDEAADLQAQNENFIQKSTHHTERCEAAPLVNPNRPRQPRLTRFNQVTLDGCPPPANYTYVQALLLLNITVYQTLWILNLPTHKRFPATALADLPSSLRELVLTTESGLLESDSNTVQGLNQLKTLKLEGVPIKTLPPHLYQLELKYTGLDVLPVNAYKVTGLKMVENRLPNMTETASNLKWLHVSAPEIRLPQAPILEQLTLSHTKADQLPERLLSSYGKLVTLDMWHLTGSTLPHKFLSGATSLTQFIARQNAFTTLPSDLFSYSPKLTLIHISDSKVNSLQSELFSSVPDLKVLSLINNELGGLALQAVLSLTSLKVLALGGNPLGDLCPAETSASSLSHLTQLESLDLVNTRVTHLCSDWLRDMHVLETLDLKQNAVQQLHCTSLQAQRNTNRLDAYIDLSGNPLTTAVCSKEDYERASNTVTQTVHLWSDAAVTCDCGSYWTARMVTERRVSVRFSPKYNGNCTSEWAQCI